jgi:hypothetical protein
MGTWRVRKCPILPVYFPVSIPWFPTSSENCETKVCTFILKLSNRKLRNVFATRSHQFWRPFLGGQKSLKLPGNPAYIACFASVCRDLQKTIPSGRALWPPTTREQNPKAQMAVREIFPWDSSHMILGDRNMFPLCGYHVNGLEQFWFF